MRELLLVRHGQAEAAAWGGDEERALTEPGRAAITAVGRALAGLGVRPDALWHSPLVRASQTAALLARELGLGAAAQRVEPLLIPDASGARAARAVVDADAACLVCVSHLPLLPDLAGRLLGARLDFGTGTVARLVLAGPHAAALIGLWSAELLARVR